MAKLHFRSPNQGSLFINIVVKAPEVADMTVFLIAVATAAPSPGLEMLPCDEPLKARKPKIRMNPPRAASYKKNGIHNELFTSTGYFLLFMNSNCVHTAIYCCIRITIQGCKSNFLFFVNYWLIFWHTNRGLTGTECPLISSGWPVSLSNRPILGPITVAATNAATPPHTCTTPLPAKS